MEHSGAGGKLIQEKNQKQKILWHCPFKRKNRNKGFLIAYNEATTIFYQNLSITVEVGGFLAAAEALLKCYE